MARALGEYGRIGKTLHLLDLADDELYRRSLLIQVNKGERRHCLARTVFHGRGGELRQAYREGQEDQLAALGLVLNAIVLWNTRYMGLALDELRTAGMLHIRREGSMTPCVLVVDDDRPIQWIVADILSEQGCEVLLASNGTEAFGHIRRRAPDVLITDLDMPGLDGWALVKMRRDDQNLRQMPIVVITAESDRRAHHSRLWASRILSPSPSTLA
jgi:CheY-like chemotaxis protein